jgi:hypothetical protein
MKETVSPRPPSACIRAAGTAEIAAAARPSRPTGRPWWRYPLLAWRPLSAAGVAAAVLAAGALFTAPGSASPYVQVERDHDGSGLSFAAGGKTVELTDFVTDPGASVLPATLSVDGEVAAERAPLFFLDGRTLNPLSVNDNGTAVLEGTTLHGMTIGVAKITINTSA